MVQHETAASPERQTAALAGLAAYQSAARGPGRPERPVAARCGRARLLDHGGEGPPLVVVPSLINPPSVLDLDDETSLMGWLAGQGVRPLLLDWGAPDPGERDLTVGGHVENLLLPLLDALGETPLLAGYCLGGTMALAAATARPTQGLALIAAPWRFVRFPEPGRTDILSGWSAARETARTMGMLPMEVLQAGFWRLDPVRTVEKFVAFGRLDPGSTEARRFVAMEDWANDGPPLTFGAASELFDGFFAQDRTGRRRWCVAGRTVVPGRIAGPVLNIVSANDRIVPRPCAPRVGRQVTLAQGHVGMIVGRGRQALHASLSGWIEAAKS